MAHLLDTMARRKELIHFGAEIAWLMDSDALLAYQRASECSSERRYGLNETIFPRINRLDARAHEVSVASWLLARVGNPDGQLMLVFGRSDVCLVRTGFFIAEWPNLFCPSRDDVVILRR